MEPTLRLHLRAGDYKNISYLYKMNRNSMIGYTGVVLVLTFFVVGLSIKMSEKKRDKYCSACSGK